MTIVFYSPRFFPLLGGLERVVEQWAAALVHNGHTVSVITSTPNQIHDDFDFKVYRNSSFYQQWQLMRAAQVVVQFNVSLKGLPQCLLSGRPLVISHHTALHYPGQTVPWQQRLKGWVANHLASGNQACSQYIARWYKACSVIGSPYNDAVFINQQIARQPQSILFVGRLVSDKGVDVLLSAFGKVAATTSAHLSIVGQGPHEELLYQQTAALRLNQRVSFLGAVAGPNLVALYNSHELVVVPSRMEPFGIVVLEALACGCKVIVANQGGLPEAAGGLAQLVPPEDAEALALAIVNQFQQSYPAANKVAAHLQRFTIKDTAQQFAQLLQPHV